MRSSIEVKDKVIFRRLYGEISVEDMLESWNELFIKFEDLSEFKGIITTFDTVPSDTDPGSVKAMVKLLNENKERLTGLRVAIVLDHPIISNAVMGDHFVKHVQVRPFVSEEAALRWVSP